VRRIVPTKSKWMEFIEMLRAKGTKRQRRGNMRPIRQKPNHKTYKKPPVAIRQEYYTREMAGIGLDL